jgi:ABC-type transporter Mla subunit MlaD
MPQHAAARALYVRVGALILVGIGLAVGFVLFLASGELGRQTATYETYIGETVQGLDVGAPVRFRGVAVGRVTEIGLTAAEYRHTDGLPFADAYRLVLVRFALDTSRSGGMPSMPEAIRLGLRVRLASQGITGVNYLEIDYVANPERFPPRGVPWEPRYPHIPAMPSTVAQVTSAAEALIVRLQQLDLEGLIGNLAGLSADLRGQLAHADLARTVAEAQAAAAAAREAIRAAELPETLRAVREAARSVREAGDAAEALVAGPDIRSAVVNTARATEEMRSALARLPQAITALEATVRAARVATTDTQAELAPILRDLRVTAQNLRDTTELLRRSPSQALFGAPPPPNPDRR